MGKKILMELKNAVIEFDGDKAINAAKKSLSLNIDPLETIEKGITAGLTEIGDRFERGEFFLTHLVTAADIAQKAIKVLEPELLKKKEVRRTLGKVVIGTVEGDIHDIGKNIVAAMLIANGFEVLDAGSDVPTERFTSLVKEEKPDILGLSALLSSTAPKQREVIDALKRERQRSSVYVIVGGGTITQSWAEEIGADGYASDAIEAVELVKKLVGCK